MPEDAAYEEFIELLERLGEEDLDAPGRARLCILLTERPELRQVAATHFTIARGLADLSRDHDAFVEHTVSHVAKIAEEGDSAFPLQVTGRIVRRRMKAILFAAAAVLLLGLAVGSFTHRSRLPVPAPEVAKLTRMGADSQVLSTEPIRAGAVYEEKVGLLRLEFTNGAVVAVEAPARFTVVSGLEVVLDSGRLNGWCPDSAHGFTVRTATGSLTDLGTSFGIHASSRQSEFVVLDGLVQVEKGTEKIRLSEGYALESTASSALNPVAFQPEDFRKTWALTYGILSTRGAAVPPKPDLLEKLVTQEDDEKLLVIPERREVPFDRAVMAEIIHSGTMPGDPDEPRPDDMDGAMHYIAPIPGKKLSSVIIRYNPVGIVPEEHFKRIEGEVTFDRPVLAVAGQQAALVDGDRMFATGVWNKEYRGIELSQNFNPPDRVTLSADRRTVKVVFYAGASTDDVRVILEDN